MKNSRKTFNLYFFSFILYCIIGWIYEVLLEIFVFKNGFVNRGFLYGPYLPIYGFGAIILLLLLKNFAYKKRYIKKINISPALSFFIIFVTTTLIEYISGVAIDTILHIRLWDYTGYFLNYNGYICFSASLRFAIGGTVFLYLLQPNFTKFINKISLKTQNFIIYILLSILLADFTITILKYL